MILGSSGIENHPDGTGDVNAIVNGDWAQINWMFNPARSFNASQDSGVAGVAGNRIRASGNAFPAANGTEGTARYVGAKVVWANGISATVTAWVSASELTASDTKNVTSQSFDIYFTTNDPKTAIVRGLVKLPKFISTDDGRIPAYDDATGVFKLVGRPGYGVTAGQILFGSGAGLDMTSSPDLTWDDSIKKATINGELLITQLLDFTPVSAGVTGAITPDFKLSNHFEYTMLGNITINNPTNVRAGTFYKIVIKQDATNGRSMSWGSNFVFPRGFRSIPNGGSLSLDVANGLSVFTIYARTTSELIVVGVGHSCLEIVGSVHRFLMGDYDSTSNKPDVRCARTSDDLHISAPNTGALWLNSDHGGDVAIGDGGAAGGYGHVKAKNVELDHATLTSGTSVTLDFRAGGLRSINTLAHNVTFATSNRAAGRSIAVRIVCDGTTRNLTFPAGWKFLNAAAPASIAANKTGVLSITAFGTADSDVVAVWAVEP